MKNKKSLLLAGAILALTAAVAFGGTLTYLTDTDEETNVFTNGDVEIDQIEEQRDPDGKLVDFVQEKPFIPAVGTPSWDPATYTDTDHNWKFFDDSFKNVQDKIVRVGNTGKSDAYIRTVFAFECGDMTWEEFDRYIGINVSDSDVNSTYTCRFEWVDGNTAGTDAGLVTIDGVKYRLAVATYANAVKPGDVTAPSLRQVYLAGAATNEICAMFGDTYEILVFSQAIQADGFANADEALTAGFGEISSQNHPWMNG